MLPACTDRRQDQRPVYMLNMLKPTNSTAQMMLTRLLLRRLLMEFIIIVLLIMPIIVFECIIEPAQRGFFCDDETIRYPLRSNTVTPLMLCFIASIPVLIFAIVEFVLYRCNAKLRATVQCFKWRMPTWIAAAAKHILYYTFGLILTFDATEVAKYTIGRLRPHFLAVCQPQMTDGSTCNDARNLNRYIENYYCMGYGFTAADVRQSRLSFPSGHSSLAFYAAIYSAIYLQHKITWQGSSFLKHLLQFAYIMLSWFVALSRIMDSWHHWSDVLVGSLIGAVCALLNARYINKLLTSNYSLDVAVRQSADSALPRQDTNATLEEVCATIPPPYCLNGFGNV